MNSYSSSCEVHTDTLVPARAAAPAAGAPHLPAECGQPEQRLERSGPSSTRIRVGRRVYIGCGRRGKLGATLRVLCERREKVVRTGAVPPGPPALSRHAHHGREMRATTSASVRALAICFRADHRRLRVYRSANRPEDSHPLDGVDPQIGLHVHAQDSSMYAGSRFLSATTAAVRD